MVPRGMADEARKFIAWLQSPVPGAPAGLEDECELCAIERQRTGSSTALCWLCEATTAVPARKAG